MATEAAASGDLPARPTIHVRDADYADSNADTETIQVPRFAGKLGTGVKLYLMVGLPTFLVFLGIGAVYLLYRDLGKPYVEAEIKQKVVVTEHTIVATEARRQDAEERRRTSDAMSSIVSELKKSNEHHEENNKVLSRMWRLLDERARPVGSRGDEQGSIAEKPEVAPGGTE